MKLPRPYATKELAEMLGCSFVGDPAFLIHGINEIHVVEPGDIVFVDHPKYYDKALNSAATTILINKEVECPEGKTLLISDDPFRDFNAITRTFRPVFPSTVAIPETAIIGEHTTIAHGAVIGEYVTIGKNCMIHPNVVIYPYTVIEDDVVIHANTTIGADAFYYKKRPEGYDQLVSGGSVHIESDVHIGSGCTIDRGVSGVTRIGRGSKLDNQIQIGHDTVLGQKVLIASHAAVAGCCVVEDEVTIWGQVGVASGLRLGKKCVILGQSGVSKDTEPGKVYFGYPADEARKKNRELASLRILPDLIEQLNRED